MAIIVQKYGGTSVGGIERIRSVAGRVIRSASRGDSDITAVAGIVCDKDQAKVSLAGVPDRPGILAGIFRTIAEDEINIDMIVEDAAGGSVLKVSLPVTAGLWCHTSPPPEITGSLRPAGRRF